VTDGPDLPLGPEPDFALAGLDAERPLPPELRARLEAALVAAVAGGLPVPADAESLDAPRPLPEAVRARLESALLAEAVVTSAEAAEVVTSLDGRRSRKVVAAWSAIAAVLLMVVAVAGLVSRGHSGSQSLQAAGGSTTTTAGTPASVPSDAGVSSESTAPATTGPTTATPRATRPGRPTPSTTGRPIGAPTATTGPGSPGSVAPATPTTPPGPGASQPAPAATDPGPAPPFYNSGSTNGDASQAPAMSSQPASPSPAAPNNGSQGAAPQTQKSATPPSAGPLRVGIITGDAAQEAGFRAYVDRLNQSGGVRGHSIDLVPISPGSPAANTIASVNLGAQPVAGPGGAPAWATGPLLETLTATENLLTGNGAVFSFASPPERQGHLAADALFPSAVTDPTTTAVIYAAPSGPLSDAVPQAMTTVLEARHVKVKVVTYDPAQKKTTLAAGADAALLSLDPEAAKAWVAQAKAAHYGPAKGVAGIYSLADDTLAPDLPAGARVISPYVVPGGDEGQAIRSGAGGTSASVLHGWAGAKALAAAIWRTGADTPPELQSALEGLAGWSSGLAPAYETRPGTRARTPEGVLFQVQSGAFVPQGAFRRDPY
jgi:hypothetical protein